ncbi:hypothetical protein WH47_04539 [Habropoda laboriosa]|uniref:Uncharacterized protein n=1 Tax=Habropoda laboriosa TaxID=597456 RepID=A0A0L7R246_9HYME|nr:PREDICTED: uncharacterized protein LOC108572753 [Habropoda laboriosa]KOC64950.1 hypothetical protein WH47_04539 [Habropoda laboriosa]
MAVTSDAMYNAGTIVPSFMSTNIYYGYVPHCKRENQRNAACEHAEISKPLLFDCCSYDTAMETDDDGCGYSTVSGRLNNDYVMLEASVQKRLKTNDKLQQCQQQTAYNADTLRHRNRKRCNSDLSPTSQLKKFREGSGKDHVHYGTGSTKDYGLATVSCESEALHVNTANNILQESMITNESCCWTAGNHNLLYNSECKQLLSSNEHKSIENSVEYEKILFETHGCSIYQFHRLQLVDNDCNETEF